MSNLKLIMSPPKDASYWRNQRALEHRSKLQRDNGGCPWPASAIAIVKSALAYTTPKGHALLKGAKLVYGISDDDIMVLLAAWEAKDWPAGDAVIEAKIKKRALKK